MIKLDSLTLFISAALFGIIWLVQRLHYPSFMFLDQLTFKTAMKHHQDRISWVVVPLMLTELLLAVVAVIRDVSTHTLTILIIVIMIWLVTFTIQVPLHSKLLLEGFNEQRIHRLVRTNWIRTLLWTLKLFVIFSTTVNSL